MNTLPNKRQTAKEQEQGENTSNRGAYIVSHEKYEGLGLRPRQTDKRSDSIAVADFDHIGQVQLTKHAIIDE